VQLELRGITKRFGSLVANKDVDLTVKPGEIHALLGENGAGKTTLMNVLFGLYHADAGEIIIDGAPVAFDGPRQALKAGIGMVHQHFKLVPPFTVAENVVLGDEPVYKRGSRRYLPGAGFLDRPAARKLINDLSARYGLEVDPDALVEDLPIGLQQRVEIVKALVRDAQLLILDEPTAVLTPQESEELFEVMRALRDSGHSMLFITHKLGEVLAVADTITVMRLGEVVGNAIPSESDQASLAAMMVGRSVNLRVDKAPATPGEVVLSVTDLVVNDERDQMAVAGLSFEVRAGEILAVAGVQGNGQSELVQALTGLSPTLAGRIVLDGADLTGHNPHQMLAAGIGHVPEDRQKEGLILSFPVAENLMLDLFDREPFSHGIVLDNGAIRANAAERIPEFDIRTPSGAVPASTLSGGNQQKIVLAREFSRALRLLVVAQPTRGLDVGSIETVHRRIVAERDKGTAVIVVSSELDEVIALGDRIAVMYEGRISGYATPDTPREEIGLLMAGSGAAVDA
jgi:general nucleoside transport system ATP-binding protein